MPHQFSHGVQRHHWYEKMRDAIVDLYYDAGTTGVLVAPTMGEICRFGQILYRMRWLISLEGC
jgi:hypothetical protein